MITAGVNAALRDSVVVAKECSRGCHEVSLMIRVEDPVELFEPAFQKMRQSSCPAGSPTRWRLLYLDTAAAAYLEVKDPTDREAQILARARGSAEGGA